MRHYWYDTEHDVGYWFDKKSVEIILGEKTWRKKDIETITLPIDSLTKFTCGLSAEELIAIDDEAAREAEGKS